ncbi:glycosyltransferase family 25 protein [Kalamiella sp. sgz302252]|uniref:glycosyltransferase family 25 protein n=1 Tax=Pantoea sp. sgz302252 TaxID=3341827 RepID=UPI0036D275CA
MRIFIINLERSVDRKNALTERCEQLGLQVEFIKAVDGRVFTKAEVEKLTAKINYAFLPGEIGCALSHQLIYKRMVEEKIDSALILEDDVTLPDYLPELIQTVSLDKNKAEVLLLSRVNKYFKKPFKKLDGNLNIHRTQSATTTHSYIINLPAATNLLRALFPVWMTADKWSLFEDYSLLTVNAVVPAPVELSASASVSTINVKKGDNSINRKKVAIWNTLMENRPLKVKIKHRIRRGLIPLIHRIVDQGKGP